MKLALAAMLSVAVVGAFANSKGDKIITEIDGLKQPSFDQTKRQDQAYIKGYSAQYELFEKQRADLILELYQSDPDNGKTANFMKERWLQFPGDSSDATAYLAALDSDIDKVLTDNPPTAIRDTAEFCKVVASLRLKGDTANVKDEVDGFVNAHPKSDLSPDLLFQASFQVKDAVRADFYREIVSKYPDYKNAGMIKGALAQTDAVGKPFALSFTDAVTGKQVDVSTLKGKVLLIDFWATWCGPCMAEMPHVIDIYNQYHSKGLEIVGVSLDMPEAQSGLTKLKDCVAKNQIPWPMYYQGNGWDSKFSSGWGIMSIPTMFIVDKNGNFQGTTDARAKDFQSKLDKYLGL